jgi:VIT1/CCC1 family predicted Fe2+/Mn2+ transporter
VSESALPDSYHDAESQKLTVSGRGLLRATFFGISDGLVSNLALVMGVAGGTESSEAIVLAGSAGLLAGAFSMAAGEYVSMMTQRESMQRQLHLEREHILRYPEQEETHMRQLLIDNGITEKSAAEMARRIHEEVDPAVDFHALLELGIVPRQMGSPVSASLASFASFVVGALIPLIPWFFVDEALRLSMACSAVALLVVGGAVTRITHRSAIAGALRQLIFGAAAAGVTNLLGRFIGWSIG